MDECPDGIEWKVRYLTMDDYEVLKVATLDSYGETFTPLMGVDARYSFGDNQRLKAGLLLRNKESNQLNDS